MQNILSKMKELLGIFFLLASKAPLIVADCSNEEPSFESYKFPAYGGVDGGANGDIFSKAPYRNCTKPTSNADDFYSQDFPIVYCDGNTEADCGNYTCAEALELNASTVNTYLRDGALAIPDGDDAACCKAVQFKVDELIGHEMKEDRCD